MAAIDSACAITPVPALPPLSMTQKARSGRRSNDAARAVSRVRLICILHHTTPPPRCDHTTPPLPSTTIVFGEAPIDGPSSTPVADNTAATVDDTSATDQPHDDDGVMAASCEPDDQKQSLSSPTSILC